MDVLCENEVTQNRSMWH